MEINIKALSGCWPLKVIGAPDIIPWSFKKAIIDPENVIAPTAAPIDISIKLPSLMSPGDPRLKAWGFKKADTLQQIFSLQALENGKQFQ